MPSMEQVKTGSTVNDMTKSDLPAPKRSWPWRNRITPWSALLSHPYNGSGTDSDPYIVTFLPDTAEGEVVDLENPQSYPAGKKWAVTMIGAISVLAVTMASSMMSAAIFEIRIDFPNKANEMYILVTSIFVLGFVVGPLIWAPAGEVLGRRRIFLLTFIPFTAFNAAACGAQSLEVLLVLRFFSGMFGSSCLTNSGGIIADMFSAAERGAAMGVFAAAPFLGPSIGPIAGGFLGQAGGWKWVAALIAFFSAILAVLGAVFQPETYPQVLLRRRAKELSKITGKVYRNEQDAKKPLRTAELFIKQMKAPWRILFTETVAFLMALYAAVIYAILYMQFTSFPIVFVQYRGWKPNIAGLAFIGLSVGAMLALIALGAANKRYAKKLEAAGGYLPPEERLPPVIIGAILLPAGLFMFAWTCAPNDIHWIVPILATVLFGMALVGLFLGIMSYLVEVYLIHSASALAGNTIVRSLFGVILPLFVVHMYDSLGVHWAGTTIAFIALAFVPAPIVFYIYGPKIRRSTRYAREADDLGRAMAQKMLAAKAAAQSPVEPGAGTRLDEETVIGRDGGLSEAQCEQDGREVKEIEAALREAADKQVSTGLAEKMEQMEELRRTVSRASLKIQENRLVREASRGSRRE